MLRYVISILIYTLALSFAHDGHNHGDHQHLQAIAYIRNSDGSVQGNITFTQQHDGQVLVEGTILGLEHGRYGFHVHEKGDITGGCLSTGGHFNPENKEHGAPEDENRHVGDLGNVEFDGYRIARINQLDKQISLTGVHGIVGRAVVLHSGTDDFGRGGHPDSRKTGNAGGRVACGVIGILSPVQGWTSGSNSIIPSIYLILTIIAIYFCKV